MTPRVFRDHGLDLVDLRSGIGQALGFDVGTTERSLLKVLFAGETLPRTPLRARTPYGWVVGYGPWIYWPRAKLADRLWRYEDAMVQSVETSAQPIISRALRDRIATIPGR